MKENTKKILSWLYFPTSAPATTPTSPTQASAPVVGSEPVNFATTVPATPATLTASTPAAPTSTPPTTPYRANYSNLAFLLPDITPGGLRSVVHYLADQSYLDIHRLDGQSYFTLTTHGRDALSRELPFFSTQLDTWQGEWSALAFLSAPKGDPQFRYLRTLLLENHAMCLRRGVYLFPGNFPSKVINTCQDLYVGKVMIFSLHAWTFGDERSFVNTHIKLSDVAQLYSGVSKEIDQLLSILKPQKRLSKALQQQIFSVFDRLFNIFNQDLGLVNYYFPTIPRGKELLRQLQKMANQQII